MDVRGSGDERAREVLQALGTGERRVNLVAAMTDTLRRQILDGHLQAGDRLPTEAALCAAAGVSRTVVREAVASLKAEGLVETRQGAGAFVLEPPKRPHIPGDLESATVEEILKILELRLAVEVEAASLAASRRTEADLQAMRDALEDFAAAREHNRDAVEADLRFHKALAAATGNQYFAAFLDYLGEYAFPRRRVPEGIRNRVVPAEQIDRVAGEHRAIYDAIAAGDTALAAVMMRMHLGGSRSRYAALLRCGEKSDSETRPDLRGGANSALGTP